MTVARKGPYRVMRGDVGQKAPPYVAAVFSGHIVLKGEPVALAAILAKLELSGLPQEESVHIPFSPAGPYPAGPYEDNRVLQDLFGRLNAAGLKFAFNNTPSSPSGIMMALQERGVVGAPFEEIAWQEPRRWFVTVHDVEERSSCPDL